MPRPCEATIDLGALRSNFDLARRLAGRREVIAVVKADAYGHGAAAVAGCLVGLGCTRLAVLTVPEGVALRTAGQAAPILVLAGARDDEEAALAVEHRLTPVLHDETGLQRLVRAVRRDPLPVHVEIDTGMHRMGVPIGEARGFLAAVHTSASLDLEGVFTHFARADEPDPAPSLEQLKRFRGLLDDLRAAGIVPPLIHADNSAALMAGEPLAGALSEATAVRPGLMLYGVRPAPHLAGDLRPVMTLRAAVLAVRDVSAGEGVGYGATWTAPRGGTRVATLAVGYADGVPWSTGSAGRVWLGGAHRPIVGRVSMDSIAVDLGADSSVGLGDEAVLFGSLSLPGETASCLPVEEAAEAAGTLHYELLVRVGARVPRVVSG